MMQFGRKRYNFVWLQNDYPTKYDLVETAACQKWGQEATISACKSNAVAGCSILATYTTVAQELQRFQGLAPPYILVKVYLP